MGTRGTRYTPILAHLAELIVYYCSKAVCWCACIWVFTSVALTTSTQQLVILHGDPDNSPQTFLPHKQSQPKMPAKRHTWCHSPWAAVSYQLSIYIHFYSLYNMIAQANNTQKQKYDKCLKKIMTVELAGETITKYVWWGGFHRQDVNTDMCRQGAKFSKLLKFYVGFFENHMLTLSFS